MAIDRSLPMDRVLAARVANLYRMAVHAARSWLAAHGAALATGVGLWGGMTALLVVVQFGTPALVGVDGYYHLRMAELIRAEDWLPEFRWLPLTILSPAAYYDHHFLYHLILAPFAWGDPAAGGAARLALGGKIASVLIASLAFLAVWVGLRRHVRWAAIWTLGLFALSEAFLYRMSMPHAQSASLLLLVIAFFLLVERRAVWLAPLGFAYVWLYDAFPLLLLVAASSLASDLILQRRMDARPILYAGLGIGLGLLVNPYFPRNLAFILQHLVPKLGQPGIPVGNEWYPYDTWALLTNSGPAFAAIGVGIFSLGKREARLDRATLMALLLTAVFGALFLRARRFAEYSPPFSLVFLALAASPWLGGWVDRRPELRRRLPLALAVFLALPLSWMTWQARQAVAGSAPLDRYGHAAAWLARHSRTGDLVFQTDWDDFPRLFFYNTTNRFTVGLDPTYLQLADEDLYEEWAAITRGEVERPSRAIGSRFGARFVFTDTQHEDFLEVAEDDPGLREIYRDRTAVVFAVLPRGER